ncbi:MAG: preprotein translocase subunit SecG [Rhodocyclaceae bacterium]|nr:MAG: preprotein translocase subunit SecG [Rhodocyclaceae bacterium]
MDEIFFPLALTLHILVGLSVIGLVLIQHGKGADMGAAFGGGASGSLFGASGSANFMSRTTGVLAAIFFLTSLGLSYMATNRVRAPVSVMDTVKTDTAPPASPVPGTPAKVDAPVQVPAPGDSRAKDIPK